MRLPIVVRMAAKFLGITVLFLLTSILAFSQHFISAKAGNIQWIQGKVFLNGTALQLGDGQYCQMENGQVLATGEGYAEVLLAPDVYLRLGENASLLMRHNELADIQLELRQGSALIEILEKLETDPIRVHASDSVVEVKKEGLYRLDAGSSKLRVYGGDAQTIKGKKKVRVKNGRMVTLDGQLKPDKFDVEEADALHHWAARRSFTLYAKTLFLAKPGFSSQLAWRSKNKGLYNSYYRVTVAINEDWNRYWSGVWSLFRRRSAEIIRLRRADPGSLHIPSTIIPYPPDDQE